MTMMSLSGGPRNQFYERLNQLLDEIDFDRKLEADAESYYQATGRKGLPRHGPGSQRLDEVDRAA